MLRVTKVVRMPLSAKQKHGKVFFLQGGKFSDPTPTTKQLRSLFPNLGLKGNATWSALCGCSCGCSPGFTVKNLGDNLFVNILNK